MLFSAREFAGSFKKVKVGKKKYRSVLKSENTCSAIKENFSAKTTSNFTFISFQTLVSLSTMFLLISFQAFRACLRSISKTILHTLIATSYLKASRNIAIISINTSRNKYVSERKWKSIFHFEFVTFAAFFHNSATIWGEISKQTWKLYKNTNERKQIFNVIAFQLFFAVYFKFSSVTFRVKKCFETNLQNFLNATSVKEEA